MKISKRTIILAIAGIVLILVAFASLYFEMNETIKELENIEEEPVKKPKKIVKEEPINETLQDNGTTITKE